MHIILASFNKIESMARTEWPWVHFPPCSVSLWFVLNLVSRWFIWFFLQSSTTLSLSLRDRSEPFLLLLPVTPVVPLAWQVSKQDFSPICFFQGRKTHQDNRCQIQMTASSYLKCDFNDLVMFTPVPPHEELKMWRGEPAERSDETDCDNTRNDFCNFLWIVSRFLYQNWLFY